MFSIRTYLLFSLSIMSAIGALLSYSEDCDARQVAWSDRNYCKENNIDEKLGLSKK